MWVSHKKSSLFFFFGCFTFLLNLVYAKSKQNPKENSINRTWIIKTRICKISSWNQQLFDVTEHINCDWISHFQLSRHFELILVFTITNTALKRNNSMTFGIGVENTMLKLNLQSQPKRKKKWSKEDDIKRMWIFLHLTQMSSQMEGANAGNKKWELKS